MTLTESERLIVIMLAEIMEELQINREIDPSLVKRLAINGDDWAIKSKYHGFLSNREQATEGQISETQNILMMWSFIEYSIAQLQGVEANEAATFHQPRFSGFDVNRDPQHGIAHTMINDLGSYGEFGSHNLNSDSSATLARYRTMLPKFAEAMRDHEGDPLPINVLRNLLN